MSLVLASNKCIICRKDDGSAEWVCKTPKENCVRNSATMVFEPKCEEGWIWDTPHYRGGG